MKDEPRESRPAIGDPPPEAPPVKAGRPMQDPFTEEVTHPAGEGQGANRPQPRQEAGGDESEEATALERGFSPVP